jgi:hypothetical protein
VSIDVSSEVLLSLAEASKVLAGRPHISSLHRWRLRGVRGIKLETVMVGGRRFVSRAALEEFAARVTAIANGDPPPVRTPARRTRDMDRAEAELAVDCTTEFTKKIGGRSRRHRGGEAAG